MYSWNMNSPCGSRTTCPHVCSTQGAAGESATSPLGSATACGRPIPTVFEDFCAMAAAAIRNRVDPHGYQAREEEYERT